MTYSRPHMYFGLALMAASAVLFVQQGCHSDERTIAPRTAISHLDEVAIAGGQRLSDGVHSCQ